MKTTLSLLTLLGLACVGYAGTGDALSVMNAFLATFAKETPAWKTDIVLTTDSAHVPTGRQLGYSTMVGYYTFLPKTWEQLTDAEKEIVYNDPRLKPFIVSLRNPQNYPSMTSAEVAVPSAPSYPVEAAYGYTPVSAPATTFAPTAIPTGYAAPATYQVAPAYAPSAAAYPAGVPSSPATTYYFPITVGGSVPAAVNAPAAAPTYYYPTSPMPTAPATYTPAPVQQPQVQPQATPYYLPTTNREVLNRPLPVSYARPQAAQIKLAAEEMLLDRPLNVYMSGAR